MNPLATAGPYPSSSPASLGRDNPLLLVDADRYLDTRLLETLEKANYRVDWAQSARTAHAALSGAEYGLLVLDLQLPDRSGLRLLSELRASGSDLLVLVISALGSLEDEVAGLDAGADDYLVKPFDHREFLARIRALFRRRYGCQHRVLRHRGVMLDPKARTVRSNGELVKLPNREYDILLMLLRQCGSVVTKHNLETALNHNVESNALEVYIHNLRRRFGKSIIRTVRGVGYVMDQSV